jgi:hypothetical protein
MRRLEGWKIARRERMRVSPVLIMDRMWKARLEDELVRSW